MKKNIPTIFIILNLTLACLPKNEQPTTGTCSDNLPTRSGVGKADTSTIAPGKSSHVGMVFVPAGAFIMGAGDQEGMPDEYPAHPVQVDGFWMDATEVTNAQFRAFVEATHYVTTAEIAPDWEEMKKQLPPGTPKPDASVLVASSLVFTPPNHPVPLDNPAQWWAWTKAADWRHPQGPNSNITGKDDYPVVQVSWDDAVAYSKWAGKRLPTEAEWEYAARSGTTGNKYPWGNEAVEQGTPKANTWQGRFPNNNTLWDKFEGLAPARSFAANPLGLYDMAGNVWEWCADWYDGAYYATVKSNTNLNPKGPARSFDPMEPTIPKRVVRGGSFLCNDTYCKGFRVSARMKSSPDTGLEHTGFRCAMN